MNKKYEVRVPRPQVREFVYKWTPKIEACGLGLGFINETDDKIIYEVDEYYDLTNEFASPHEFTNTERYQELFIQAMEDNHPITMIYHSHPHSPQFSGIDYHFMAGLCRPWIIVAQDKVNAYIRVGDNVFIVDIKLIA